MLQNPFESFLMAGYECADEINRMGRRVNLRVLSQHDDRVLEDYADIQILGIKSVREGICWSVVETSPYQFDFSSLIPFFDAAKVHNIQIIWDMCHFGYPDDLFPTHPLFVSRFAALCSAFIDFHQQNTMHIPILVPINEISFLAWHSGDVRGTVPFAENSGWDIKYHLAKAAIAGIKTIKGKCPEAIIIAVEPLVKIHAADLNVNSHQLKEQNKIQFQALDIMLGRICPELGGAEELIDIVGANYYYNNQWDTEGNTLGWHCDERYIPLEFLLQDLYHRYKKPFMLSETGHFGLDKAEWLASIAATTLELISQNLPFWGCCIYPIIDRADWDNLDYYCGAGVWEVDSNQNRIAHLPSINILDNFQDRLKKVLVLRNILVP